MNRKYFSLVELLTVITVIVILAGIAIPVVMHMATKGKETKARAEMNAIKLGLTQFKSDYSIWPQISPDSSLIKNGDLFLETRYNTGDTTPYTTAEGDYDKLMTSLTRTLPSDGSIPTDTYGNTKKIKYLDPPPKKVTAYVDGTSGYYKLDPWGRRYNIALDWNYDGKISLTSSDSFARETEKSDILDKILVYSYGNADLDKNHKFDTEAFLYSWKDSGN